MDFELISPEEFDALPEDDEQCFVEFESICRRNMTRMLNEETNTGFTRSVQAQYMACVSAVAAECGFPNLAQSVPAEDDHRFWPEFGEFCLAVQGEVARIRIRGRRSRNALSVQLTDNTRTKIEHYISRLREAIDKSDLPDHRKKALRAKLEELTEALGERRLNLGRTMALLSAILVGLGAVTTISADGPKAVSHIMHFIGVDKESEDEAVARLAAPPKALPAPTPPSHAQPAARPVPSFGRPRNPNDDLDDEIPF